jgi:hypothetical protein
MFSKTKIALSAAVVLSIAFPASAATKHHRVTHVHSAIYNIVIPTAAGWRLYGVWWPSSQ